MPLVIKIENGAGIAVRHILPTDTPAANEIVLSGSAIADIVQMSLCETALDEGGMFAVVPLQEMPMDFEVQHMSTDFMKELELHGEQGGYKVRSTDHGSIVIEIADGFGAFITDIRGYDGVQIEIKSLADILISEGTLKCIIKLAGITREGLPNPLDYQDYRKLPADIRGKFKALLTRMQDHMKVATAPQVIFNMFRVL